jgi:hypothetical protein
MSRDHKDNKAAMAEDGVRRAAAHVRPLALRSSTAAKRGVHEARAQLAPRIERSGQALQETVAPKLAAYLSTAARRVAPDVPRRSRWVARTRIAGVAAAAVATVTAVVRRRTRHQATNSEDDTAQSEVMTTD